MANNVGRPKKYKMDDIVTVVSLVRNGKLVFVDAEGVTHEWNSWGDEIDLTFKDVRKMAIQNKRFFKDCWVRIPDDVSRQLKIKDYLLDSKIDVDRIDTLFTLKPEKFKELLLSSSDGVRKMVADKAVDMLKKDELDSRKILRIIKEVTGIDIEAFSEIIEEKDLKQD